MLWAIIVILLILWLLGAFGNRAGLRIPRAGGWIHTLLFIIVILVILEILGVI
jgi:hypothetical protein